jgi:hypothetical protein
MNPAVTRDDTTTPAAVAPAVGEALRHYLIGEMNGSPGN